VLGSDYYVLGSPQEIPVNAQDLVVLRSASSTLSPFSSRLVIPEGKCNPSRNVWWKFVDPSETPYGGRGVANRDRLDCRRKQMNNQLVTVEQLMQAVSMLGAPAGI
jgi:hypothetical protein